MPIQVTCTSCGKTIKNLPDIKHYRKWRIKTNQCPECDAPLDMSISTKFVKGD